jgi:hypothetical protein
MTTIELGEMPHPHPVPPTLAERIWASVGELSLVTVILAAVAASLLVAAAILL